MSSTTSNRPFGRSFNNAAALIASLVAAVAAASVAALWASPPDLVRVGANYAAKIVCSNVFLAGREPAAVLRTDVQAPGNPLLRLMRVDVDREHGLVHAGLFGFIGGGLALARAGAGCTVVPDGRLDLVSGAAARAGRAAPPAQPASAAPWPDGDQGSSSPEVAKLLANDALAGPGMRAIVAVHDGRLIGERYGTGFTAGTPLLGWSMTKTVTAGLIGLLVKDGRLALSDTAGWRDGAPDDGRRRIRIADLLSMTSGLAFNEAYGTVSDVTRMLYLEPDMAAFARAQRLAHPVGAFWSYSSGTAVILARAVQDALGGDALGFARTRLFEPLGMSSAVIEADARGTLVGSSYMYATARDWARYGMLLAQDGRWRGEALLPPGYVAMMAAPVAASNGRYGHGQVWLHRGDAALGIPADTFWLEGHDGQFMAIVPSRALVLLRMGLTPSKWGYQPQPLLRALLVAVPPA